MAWAASAARLRGLGRRSGLLDGLFGRECRHGVLPLDGLSGRLEGGVNDGAVAGQAGGLDELVVPLHGQLLGFLVTSVSTKA